MAAEPLDSLRLALMQEVLPLGLAVVERARRGGPREVLAAFEDGAGDPLGRLRQEGEPAARQLRDNLDRLQPGLGNPVVRVDVRDVPDAGADSDRAEAPGSDPEAQNPAELLEALERISSRLACLESRLLPSRPESSQGERSS